MYVYVYYVYVYVCMHVHMYVCMYVQCTYVWYCVYVLTRRSPCLSLNVAKYQCFLSCLILWDTHILATLGGINFEIWVCFISVWKVLKTMI